MNPSTAVPEYPRLRHCTFVEKHDRKSMTMIVGKKYFELSELSGSREKLLEVKRYFDGRHSIGEISQITQVPHTDIEELVRVLGQADVLRTESELTRVPTVDFLRRIEDSCSMWSRQIGYHSLFGALERGELRKEVFVGLVLETYHFVRSASRHISVALASCKDERWSPMLSRYLAEEHDHSGLILQTLENLGVSRDRTIAAHPLIGTLSLINMLCEIGRRNTLAYLACTSLFEARGEEFVEAKDSLYKMADHHGFESAQLAPLVRHAQGDIEAGHVSLLSLALEGRETICAEDAHEAVNCLHDLKHSFDQFHDQIIQYYSDISNYIPRLRVDYFSL